MSRRAQERRIARMKVDGKDVELSKHPLAAPGHWHVNLVVYSHEDKGTLLDAVHFNNVFTDDLVLCEAVAVAVARELSGPTRELVRVEEATYCPDPEHRLNSEFSRK